MILNIIKRFTYFKASSISCLLIVIISFLNGCTNRNAVKFTKEMAAIAWADMSLYITKNTPSNSPTFASRGFAYISITMYESLVHGFPTHRSLVGQLNELSALPLPVPNTTYNWVLSMNAGQALILKKIYQQTSEANKRKIDSLENLIVKQFSAEVHDKAIIDRSIAYGKSIAETIYKWSLTDGGHRAYLHNFDKSIKWPTALGHWEPPLYGQSFSHYPLHPHWGNNRVFIKANGKLATPKMIAFDSVVSSAYYNQMATVLKKNTSITLNEKEVALWWADDPGDTFTPPGHSFYIATQVLKMKKPNLIMHAEAYARTGIAVADAFINCWKWKYIFFSERPSSFITKYIDNTWESFWPDPPFPAFPSGHATQAGAASEVLIDIFGDKCNLIDSAHVGRLRDKVRNVDFKPRKYFSFRQLASEIADSRLYGGIHTPQDNSEGLKVGYQVAQNVNSLFWHNKK